MNETDIFQTYTHYKTKVKEDNFGTKQLSLRHKNIVIRKKFHPIIYPVEKFSNPPLKLYLLFLSNPKSHQSLKNLA